MVTLHLVARVQADGTLELKTPTPLPAGEVEVTLLIQPLNTSAAEWPAGYFDRTFSKWEGRTGASPARRL
jgi:hypothetical protein